MLPRVLANIRPTWVVPSVCAITPRFLADRSIRTLIWDVDGTLSHYHSPHFAPEAAAHFEYLRSMDGLRHAVLSNCSEQRFEQLAALLPGVPVIKAYRSTSGLLVRVRTGVREAWSAEPRGGLHPVRKPHPHLVGAALRALEIDDPRSVAMVGDQCLTDIAGANLAGIRSIKVPTLGQATCPPAVRVLQYIDNVIFQIGEIVRRRPLDE